MSWPNWLPLRENLRSLSPYGAPQVPAQAFLNTNENPFPPSEQLQAAIAKAVSDVTSQLNRYPDRDAELLRSKLASYINNLSGTDFTFNNIWVANGSNEVIQSLFLAFGEGSALGFTPSYSMHALIGKVSNTVWIDGFRDSDFTLNTKEAIDQILLHKPAMTFVTTPNNPTGGAVALAEIAKIADTVKTVGGLLVVDEAYAEFSKELSAVTLISKNPHVVVVRTMSKAFAFAGARVGYLVADPMVKDAMMIVRLPYHLSSITQAVAQVALDFKDELLAGVETLIQSRESLITSLSSLGLTTVKTDANFILFTGFKQNARELWSDLLKKGVLIRDVGLSGHLRVTIGTEAENKLFISALKELI
jgi:histidinol-phosphate aminotransferase